MTGGNMRNQELDKDLQVLAQKLRFLVKICKEADSDTENRFCVELVGRELSAYAGNVDEMVSGPPKSLPPQAPKPAPQVSSAPPLVGAKALNPEPSRKPTAAAPLDFPIDD